MAVQESEASARRKRCLPLYSFASRAIVRGTQKQRKGGLTVARGPRSSRPPLAGKNPF